MSSYRFCRTDDIALLVDALNRCWAPYAPNEPPMTQPAFKRSIRDLQVWCSSCMVAFAGADPIGVLIGAKRPSGTLVHTIAVHPDHRRQGHARHLLTSLGSKLAILGPPRLVAEVPESSADACGLFGATGYVDQGRLTDYVFDPQEHDAREVVGLSRDERAPRDGASRKGFVIPITIDDLIANGLLGADQSPVCWARSVETLTARKDDIAGLAVATDERIEAFVLYLTPDERSVDIVALRSLDENGGDVLKQLLAQLHARGVQTVRFPKVHPAEIASDSLDALGFRRTGGHLQYAARAGALPPSSPLAVPRGSGG